MYISHIEIFSEVVYFQKFKAFDLYCVNDTNIEYIQVECCCFKKRHFSALLRQENFEYFKNYSQKSAGICCASVLNNIIIKKANRSV